MKVKKLSPALLLILTSSLLFSACKEENKDCSADYIKSLELTKLSFRNVQKTGADISEVTAFKSSLESFLKSYKNVSCTSAGKTLNPTAEVTAMLNEIPQQKVRLTNKVIYGNDDRTDVRTTPSERNKALAQSVAMQVSKRNISDTGELSQTTLGQSFSLCKDQRFANQINPGRCSGFLIGPDLIVTAGHCVENQGDCDQYKWVFGFQDNVTNLSANNIYHCKKIISQKLESGEGLDYAVIQLKRPVIGRTPLKFRRSGKISTGEKILVIGHPSGLPVKVATDAIVRSNSPKTHFVTNLDTFGGNSGSPVFNATTGLVEGILVRGETDYNWKTEADGNKCQVVNICQAKKCRGEDVTRITKVKGLPASNLPLSVDEIFNGLFRDQTFLKMTFSGPIPNLTYKLKEHFIAANKFLGVCSLHQGLVTAPMLHIENIITECRNKELLKKLIVNFRNAP